MNKRALARKRKSKIAESQFYLTVAIRDRRCENGKGTSKRCRVIMRRGSPLVYRYSPRTCLCPDCAKSLGVSYKPSSRLRNIQAGISRHSDTELRMIEQTEGEAMRAKPAT